MWVGDLRHPDPHRRIPALVHAPRELPLVLVGAAGRWAQELDGGVIVTGEVGDDALAALYTGAHALVLPSAEEGFGLPAVEALACGTPVVAADGPSLREVLDGRVTFVDAGDLPGIAGCRAGRDPARAGPAGVDVGRRRRGDVARLRDRARGLGTRAAHAAAPDPQRDARARLRRAAAARRSDARLRGGSRPGRATRPTTAATRSWSCPSPPRRSPRGRRWCSSPTCTPTISTRPRWRCSRATGRCCASRRTPTRCASAASPTCGRSRTSWRSTGCASSRTGGQHGTGEIAEMLAPVSGFVLRADGEPTVYVAGDTIWCDEVARRDRRARARRRGRQRERRALQRGRPDRHDRRGRRHRRAPRTPGARSSPSTSRRSTTASSRAARTPTCRSACPRTAPRSRDLSPSRSARLAAPIAG